MKNTKYKNVFYKIHLCVLYFIKAKSVIAYFNTKLQTNKTYDYSF